MQSFTDINFKQIIVALFHKAWIIILSALLLGGASYLYTANFITPMYRASVSIYVNNAPRSQNSEVISGSNLATAERLVTTYVNIIRSDTVLEKVAEKLDNGMRAGAIRSMMSANSIDGTEMFEIHVASSDPELAAEVANAIADVAPGEISNFLEGSSTKIIDYAKVPGSRYTPSFRNNTFLGCLIGGGIAALIIVLWVVMDKRIKSEEDLERLFDLPVLGVIPAFDVEHKKGGYGTKYSAGGYAAK